MKVIEQINKWHDTKLGLIAFCLVEFAASYGFVLWAINNGSISLYLITLILLVGSVKNLIRLTGKLYHDFYKH